MMDKLTPLSPGDAEAMGLHYVGQVNGRPVFVCGSLVTIKAPAEFDSGQMQADIGTEGPSAPVPRQAEEHEVAATLQTAREDAERLLEDAVKAAEGVRQAAQDDAARILAEAGRIQQDANSEAGSTRHAASLDAAAVRQSAQDEAAVILAEARETAQAAIDTADNIRQAADLDAATIRENAQEEAARLLADARTGTQALLQEARGEAERIVFEAKKTSEEADSYASTTRQAGSRINCVTAPANTSTSPMGARMPLTLS